MCNCNYNIHQHYFTLKGIKDLYGDEPLTDYVSITFTENIPLILYGALALMARNNKELLNEIDTDIDDVITNARMSNSQLYFNDWEGYYLTNRYVLNSLFLSDSGIILSVFDNKKDRYLNFKVN